MNWKFLKPVLNTRGTCNWAVSEATVVPRHNVYSLRNCPNLMTASNDKSRIYAYNTRKVANICVPIRRNTRMQYAKIRVYTRIYDPRTSHTTVTVRLLPSLCFPNPVYVLLLPASSTNIAASITRQVYPVSTHAARFSCHLFRDKHVWSCAWRKSGAHKDFVKRPFYYNKEQMRWT